MDKTQKLNDPKGKYQIQKMDGTWQLTGISGSMKYKYNDNDKPIKSLLKGKGLLPPVGLARLDS
jgi:hypothetical protein